MNINLPSAGSGLPQIIDALRRAFISVVSQDQAAPRVILQSPNGKSWAVTVSDTGVISTAVLDGNTRP